MSTTAILNLKGGVAKTGLSAVRFKVSEAAPGEIHNFARWDGFCWTAVRSGKPYADMIAAFWAPLPEMEGPKK